MKNRKAWRKHQKLMARHASSHHQMGGMLDIHRDKPAGAKMAKKARMSALGIRGPRSAILNTFIAIRQTVRGLT